MYRIEQFEELNRPENMVLTQHSRKRFSERGIKIQDITNAIETGEIIEDYPEDYPFPSCLILGKSGEVNIHIVASINADMIYSTLYRGQDITRHVDLEQLARFLMVNELISNFELYHPKSTFCYRESFESDTSKYVFGPVWDLDWAFGYEGHSRYFQDNASSNYWLDMPNFEVKQFIQEVTVVDFEKAA